MGVIQQEYAIYYHQLPTNASVRDCLPDPSADEVEDDGREIEELSTGSGGIDILPIAV